MYNVIAYNPEEPLLYDTFPDDFTWGAATAAYQVEFFNMNKTGWRGTSIGGRKPTQSERNSVYFLFVGSNGKIYYFYYLSRDLTMQ